MAAPGRAEHALPPLQRMAVTVAIMAATIIVVLDMSIANVALPSMQGSLSATRDTITWVLTSYIVATAIMTPMTGWLSDRFGRRRLFLVCIAGFTTTSVMCGLAGSLGEIVLYRILQGGFGAALMPLSQSVLLDINPQERHGHAMAVWGSGIMLGPILGPTLGGWLTDLLDWRWIFFINLPIGIVTFLGIAAFLPEFRARARRFDFLGFAYLSIGVGALQMMLDRGEQLDWLASTEIRIELGLTVAALWAFVIHSIYSANPFISVSMFRDRNFSVGLIFIFIIGVILLATIALLAPMLQIVMGYPTMTTGLALAPRGVGVMITMIVAGRLSQHVDPRLLLLTGLLLIVWSMHMMTGFSIEMDVWPVVYTGVIQGLGMGLLFVPLTMMAFATLPAHLRTEATSLFNLIRNLGSSVGTSIVVTVLTWNTYINHADLAARISPDNAPLAARLPQLLENNPQYLMLLDKEISRQALMIAYISDFKLIMYLSLFAIPLLLLLRRPSGPQGAPVPVMD